MKPFAVYEMAPTGINGAMEAQCVAAWACCYEHAQLLRCPEAVQSVGQNDGALPGTVCEVCGVVIAEDEEALPEHGMRVTKRT